MRKKEAYFSYASMKSISVMHFFRKNKDVAELDLLSVIKDRVSGHTPEDLMLVGNDDLKIHLGKPVENRNELRLEASVGR